MVVVLPACVRACESLSRRRGEESGRERAHHHGGDGDDVVVAEGVPPRLGRDRSDFRRGSGGDRGDRGQPREGGECRTPRTRTRIDSRDRRPKLTKLSPQTLSHPSLPLSLPLPRARARSQVDLTSDSLVIASVMNLKNEEAKALSSFVYCASEIVKDRTLLWIEFDEGDSGEDNAGVTARLDWTLDASKCMEVTLASPLASKKETTVEIYEVYSLDFVPLPAEIRQSQPQQVGFTNFDVVVSDPGHLRVKIQTTRVFLPSAKVDHYTEVKPSAHKGAEIVYGPYTAPVSGKTVVTIVVQHPDPLLRIEQVTRDITVSSWTDIDVQEHYHIKNVGPPFKEGFSRIEYTRNPQRYIANELSMVLPKQAHSIFFIDVLGNITTSKAKFEFTRVAVDAVPRFPLAPGWQTHFTFGYKVPKQSFVKQDPKTGAKSVVMDVLPAVKGIYIKNLTINAAVPEFSTDVTCAPLTTSALFTQADPYREVKAGAHTKKWWFDISGRPVRSLELSDLSSELSHLTFHLKYQFSDILEFKEVFMIAAAWAVVCLIASAWSYSDFTLVRGKAKVKTS